MKLGCGLIAIKPSRATRQDKQGHWAMSDKADIIYTIVDEAPELASGSFLPIIRAFAGPAGISFGTNDPACE